MLRRSTLTSLLLLAGCRSLDRAPEPLAAPDLGVRVEHHLGSPLSGALGRAELARTDADPSRTFAIAIECTFVEAAPGGELAPLAERAKLVVSDEGAEPFRASSSLVEGVRVGAGDAATRHVEAAKRLRNVSCATIATALPAGVTLRLEGRDPRGGEGTFELELARGSATDELVATLRAERPVDPSSDAAAQRRTVARDRFVLADTAALDGAPLVVQWPAPTERAPGAVVLAIVHARSAPDEPNASSEHAKLTRAALDGALACEREAQARGRGVSRDETFEREVAAAFRALDVERDHRSGIVFLATEARAPLALDLALVAESADLDAFVRALVAGASARASEAREARTLGWQIERTAFEFLAKRLETNELPNELVGVLLRHAGEVARWSGTLQDLVRDAHDVDDLVRALERENTIFLEDTDPSARTRAFDWLRARGLAPEAYDPLADAKSRRSALEHAAEARESAESRKP